MSGELQTKGTIKGLYECGRRQEWGERRGKQSSERVGGEAAQCRGERARAVDNEASSVQTEPVSHGQAEGRHLPDWTLRRGAYSVLYRLYSIRTSPKREQQSDRISRKTVMGGAKVLE